MPNPPTLPDITPQNRIKELFATSEKVIDSSPSLDPTIGQIIGSLLAKTNQASALTQIIAALREEVTLLVAERDTLRVDLDKVTQTLHALAKDEGKSDPVAKK